MSPLPLPYSFARDSGLAVEKTESGAVLYISDRADTACLAEVRRAAGPITTVKPITNADFETLLSTLYAARAFGTSTDQTDGVGDQEAGLSEALAGAEQSVDLLAGDDDAPVIRLLNSLFSEALMRGASDIHLEPFEDKVSVRIRVDGVMDKVIDLSPRLAPYMVSRVKVMARLDIAEKRLPQDGRFSLTLGGRGFDVRLSTLPIRYGERVVMRLLDAAKARINLADLGMETGLNDRFLKCLDEPNGIILVTGPTGSGKTTTLYAALGLLNDQSRNIMTVEDPVEYALDGVSQTQVNPKIGMTFAAGLRSILRQDPDVVMVGEIRDRETAEMAVQASMTGHLVLSTVHTNSAVAAIARLSDMGVERFLLATTIKGILAQRLVRVLCPHCKKSSPITPAEETQFGLGGYGDLQRAVGCDQCGNSGYKGRRGIYEFVQVDDNLSKMIQAGEGEQALTAYAFNSQSQSQSQSLPQSLSDSGRSLIKAGLTTIEEVMRVSRLSDDRSGAPDASL